MIFSIDAEEKKDRPVLITESGERYSYKDLCAAVSDFAKAVRSACGLETAGARGGQGSAGDSYGQYRNGQKAGAACVRRPLIFILCENSPGAVIGYLGAIEAGAVPLLLSADPEAGMERLAAVYRPVLVWKPVLCLPQTKREGLGTDGRKASALQSDIPCVKQDPGVTVYKACGYELLRTGALPYPVHPDLTLLLATSGSTGSPKLVRLTRRNLESNAASIAAYLQLSKEERPVTTLPMQYTYGLSVINSHLLAGGCILLTDTSIVQQGFWDFLERERATGLAGVPYTYQLLERLRFCERPAGSLRSLTQAGGKLPEALQWRFGAWAADNGVSFYIMYGQTEATARMSYLPPEDCLKKIGSIGIPIPGGRFLLSDPAGDPDRYSDEYPDGNPIGTAAENLAEDSVKSARDRQGDLRFEAVGELVYEGDNVTPGYAESAADLVKGDERGGRLYTGDLAGRDADGYYYIIGRKNRFVKLYGVRVSLDACEQILQELYPDCEAVCIGRSSDAREELIVFLTDAQAAAECAGRLAERIRINPRAIRAAYIASIPKNSAGKVQYGLLREKLSGQE